MFYLIPGIDPWCNFDNNTSSFNWGQQLPAAAPLQQDKNCLRNTTKTQAHNSYVNASGLISSNKVTDSVVYFYHMTKLEVAK